MEFSFGPQEDIANIRLVDSIADGAITEDVHIERPGADIYLGFSADGHLLEIEILGASSVLDHQMLASAVLMDERPVPDGSQDHEADSRER